MGFQSELVSRGSNGPPTHAAYDDLGACMEGFNGLNMASWLARAVLLMVHS